MNGEEIDVLREQLHQEIDLHDKPEIEVRATIAAQQATISRLRKALEAIEKYVWRDMDEMKTIARADVSELMGRLEQLAQRSDEPRPGWIREAIDALRFMAAERDNQTVRANELERQIGRLIDAAHAEKDHVQGNVYRVGEFLQASATSPAANDPTSGVYVEKLAVDAAYAAMLAERNALATASFTLTARIEALQEALGRIVGLTVNSDHKRNTANLIMANDIARAALKEVE